MSTKEVESPHQDGPSWNIVARCVNYAEAHLKRLELMTEKDLQVKVHYQGPPRRKFYAVKTRIDPDSLRKEDKKKKNSKKRRKK